MDSSVSDNFSSSSFKSSAFVSTLISVFYRSIAKTAVINRIILNYFNENSLLMETVSTVDVSSFSQLSVLNQFQNNFQIKWLKNEPSNRKEKWTFWKWGCVREESIRPISVSIWLIESEFVVILVVRRSFLRIHNCLIPGKSTNYMI